MRPRRKTLGNPAMQSFGVAEPWQLIPSAVGHAIPGDPKVVDGQASAIGVKDGVASGSRQLSLAKLLQRTEVGSWPQHAEIQQAVHYASSAEFFHQRN